MKKVAPSLTAGNAGSPRIAQKNRQKVKMDADERLIELFKVGCPKCKQKDSFFLDSTEQIRRRVWPDPEDREFIEYGDTDYIDTVSEDFIICPNCFWEEALGE